MCLDKFRRVLKLVDHELRYLILIELCIIFDFICIFISFNLWSLSSAFRFHVYVYIYIYIYIYICMYIYIYIYIYGKEQIITLWLSSQVLGVSGVIPDISGKNAGIFRFVTTLLEIPNIPNFHPGNSTKLQSCGVTQWPPPPPPPHPFLGNVKTKNQDPWNSSFLIKPRNIYKVFLR